MHRLLVSTILSGLFLLPTAAEACGPEGLAGIGGRGLGFSNLGGFRSNGNFGVAGYSGVNPAAFAMAQQAQIQNARQLFAAQARARRERLRPARLAKYRQKREEMLAKREQHRAMIAARLNAQRQAKEGRSQDQFEQQSNFPAPLVAINRR